MTSGNREFDPDDAAHFRTILEMQIEHLEEVIIKKLKEGELSYQPAFGLVDEQGKAEQYLGDFDTIWSDIQNVKSSLKSMVSMVDGALENHEFSESENVRDLNILDLNDTIHDSGDTTPPPPPGGDQIPH